MLETTIARLREDLQARNAADIDRLAADLHPADWLDLSHHLDDDEFRALLELLPAAVASDILADVPPGVAADLLDGLSAARTRRLMAGIDPDDATDILQALPATEAEALLATLDREDAAPILPLLAWPPGTAGALMTPEFVAIRPDIRAEQAITALRSLAAEAELANYVYVVDPLDALLGVLSLRNLVLAPPDTPVRQAMVTPVTSVRADDAEEDAVRLLRDRNLLAIPVTDEAGRLLGVITHDDAVDALESALVDDYMKLAGTDAEEMERKSPLEVARLRVPWLVGTMLIELGAGLVISRFDGVLQRVILLASFMPVISAVSGNVGLQAAAIVVRGLDTGQVALSQWRRHLRRELLTTLAMAVVCGLLLGLIGIAWSRQLAFGVVIGAALTCSMLTAGTMGSLIPLASKKLGFDPATTAGPFETAFQDVVGFAVFLWMASLLVNVID